MATMPREKVINLGKSCAKGVSSFEIFTTTRSCENAHNASLWGLIMAHQNDSSHVKGHILLRDGLDSVLWKTTLPLVVKNSSVMRCGH